MQERIPIKEIELEKMKFGCRGLMPVEAFIELNQSEIQDHIEWTFKSYIISKEIKSGQFEIEIDLPDGLWNQFKQKFFPERLIKRFPVRKIRKVVSGKLVDIFPESKYEFPKSIGNRYRIMTLNEPSYFI